MEVISLALTTAGDYLFVTTMAYNSKMNTENENEITDPSKEDRKY